MTKPRDFELEDADQADGIPSVGNLSEALERAKADMSQALRAAQPILPPAERKYHVLAVDDNAIFLDTLREEAERLNIGIETLQPTHKESVRERILAAFTAGQGFDFVLLDYSFNDCDFDGLDILRTLRQDENTPPLAKLECQDIRLYYLPVAIVTRGGSVVHNDLYFNEKALGAGADKVYSEKGFGPEEIVGHEGGLSARPLLESLCKNGFKEMRFRAWARLWQDLRDQLEARIKDELGENLWGTESGIDRSLVSVWSAIAEPILNAGYATHLSMKILKYDKRGRQWMLHKMGEFDEDGCPKVIAWDALPLLKKILSTSMSACVIPELTEKHLGEINAPGYPEELRQFSKYLGHRAMAVRLASREGTVGTFLITREHGQQPFFKEEQQYLKTIVERLGLFYRELRMRHRNHHRQLALVRLGRELLNEDEEDKIVAKAVKALHMHLHRWRSVFTPDPQNNPAWNGRVSIRLIEPGTGRLMRPNQENWPVKPDAPHIPRWALGFDTRNTQPPKKIGLADDERYKTLIEEGKALFFPNADRTQVQDRRVDMTHAKMLAPIKAGPVVVGTVNVEHTDREFYGKHEKTSGDFALLQAVASEVGQALRALRARRMQRSLLELLEKTGQDTEDQVINRLMDILYKYTGCAVGLWVVPSSTGWDIKQVWECRQGYDEDESPPERFHVEHKKETHRLSDWRQHVSNNFARSLVGKLVNGQLSEEDSGSNLVYYTEEDFLDDTALGIVTRSGAVLALRNSTSQDLLGVFGLVFNQKPGLEFDRQRPLLEGAARFAAEYLSIRRENRQYLLNSQIMQQQAALGDAYQQLRHSLRLQLMGLSGKLSRLLLEIDEPDASREHAKSLAEEMKRILSHIDESIEMSKVLVNPPELVNFDLREVWNAVCEKLQSSAEREKVEIVVMTESLWVHMDRTTLELVFTNLMGNAIEAMGNQSKARRIECAKLPSTRQGFVRVSVRDTGPGIPPAIKDRLFKEIGISTKPAGTGFQTYFSAFKLEQTGGQIEHDLDWKDGAGFVLTLPQATD